MIAHNSIFKYPRITAAPVSRCLTSLNQVLGTPQRPPKTSTRTVLQPSERSRRPSIIFPVASTEISQHHHPTITHTHHTLVNQVFPFFASLCCAESFGEYSSSFGHWQRCPRFTPRRNDTLRYQRTSRPVVSVMIQDCAVVRVCRGHSHLVA